MRASLLFLHSLHRKPDNAAEKGKGDHQHGLGEQQNQHQTDPFAALLRSFVIVLAHVAASFPLS
jgi:hypothetical protein